MVASLALRSTLASALVLSGCAAVTSFDQEPSGSGGSTSTSGATTAPSSSSDATAPSGAQGTGGEPGTGPGGPGSSGVTSAGGDGQGGDAAVGTGTSGTGGEGGEGGGPACDGADLSSDPANCGVCGFDCGGGPCVQGRCEESIELGGLGFDVTSVLVADDRLYFVQRQEPSTKSDPENYVGTLATLPLDFTEDSEPEVIGEVINSIGRLVRGTIGTHRVYFTGQSFMGETPQHLYACSPSECVTVDLSPADIGAPQNDELFPQANGLAAVGGTLYVLESAGSNRLKSTSIDPATGIPEDELQLEVVAYAEPVGGFGVLGLAHDATTGRLIWSTWEPAPAGEPTTSLYAAEVSALPLGGAIARWTIEFPANGFVVAPDGAIFVGYGTSEVRRVSEDGQSLEPFATTAVPAAADDRFMYVVDTGTNAIRAIPLAGGPDAGNAPPPSSGRGPVDVGHPTYVYYADGDTIRRWAKPR